MPHFGVLERPGKVVATFLPVVVCGMSLRMQIKSHHREP